MERTTIFLLVIDSVSIYPEDIPEKKLIKKEDRPCQNDHFFGKIGDNFYYLAEIN
ncbi:MAG: hypothetical protein ACOC4B_02205 [Bacteroidota bacterium]